MGQRHHKKGKSKSESVAEVYAFSLIVEIFRVRELERLHARPYKQSQRVTRLNIRRKPRESLSQRCLIIVTSARMCVLFGS